MVNKITRIAMWSGPRNISTALMRSWGNRLDTAVCDEPFYAHFLQETQIDGHHAADEVIAHHETDWRKVIEFLVGELPEGKTVFYQKQMTHHFLPVIDRSWLDQVTNCFLIREPREMIPSYIKHRANPTLEDIGLPQQLEIFNWVRDRNGTEPVILDARDVLTDPRRLMGLLCDAVGLEFTDRMMEWPPGFRETDGIWARHWYKEVVTSTSFRPYKPKGEPVPERLKELHRQSQEIYAQMYPHRLR